MALTERIRKDFSKYEHILAEAYLRELTLNHVMAKSENNLFSARMAILELSKGNLQDLKYYLTAAQSDFRDVIFWATEERKK